MEVRTAVPGDLPELLRIYAAAREAMKRAGNPTQWGDHRPSRETLEEDIRQKDLFLMLEDGRAVGAFVFRPGPEAAYEAIRGEWLDQRPYWVIHRVASDGTARGILDRCLAFCGTVTGSLKIDTHRDNRIMQHLLERHGFFSCGEILAEDGTPRIAYQRTEEKKKAAPPPGGAGLPGQ